jgi:DNA-binding beta-propeller fold protein YncE
MNIQAGPLTYEWISDWTDLPVQTEWAHHGMAVTRDGIIVTSTADNAGILFLSPDGKILNSFPVMETDTHGITISDENGRDILWIVGNGGLVLKCELDGTVLARLSRDDFDYAAEDPFMPTALAVDPATGQVWITDGYGSSRVHRFSPDLKLELTLDGSTGAGEFNCPHWVHCDTRAENTRLYVADRGNDRIQVFGTDGSFIKCIDDGLITPSGFAVVENFLIVAELHARVVVLDADDRIVGEIGNGREYVLRPGWPNRLDADGDPGCVLDEIAEEKFNSPHGIAADANGNIYVSEWLIGDRHIKLHRTA